MTPDTTDHGEWVAGTFDGARRRHALAVAATSPERRIAWLEEALRVAAASGALANWRRERHRHLTAQWNDGDTDPR